MFQNLVLNHSNDYDKVELLYSHIVKILTEDDLINISDKAQLKELEIKVILPTKFRDEGITQRFIKWLLGDRAVDELAVLLRHLVHAAVPPSHMLVGFTHPHHAHSKVEYWPPKAASAGSTQTRLELTPQHLRFQNRWIQGALAAT
ncbi:hypothetical protein T07_15012 [Trichinella nelsoni]|uniref:Uncharacterized protein n=1 Tax=Trichinella nelsoni TaxID=6336 RepID=A0A0V0S2G1_9BILA|nr:hypothetical protein T07_15012 [Trichinella nelsoni]